MLTRIHSEYLVDLESLVAVDLNTETESGENCVILWFKDSEDKQIFTGDSAQEVREYFHDCFGTSLIDE